MLSIHAASGSKLRPLSPILFSRRHSPSLRAPKCAPIDQSAPFIHELNKTNPRPARTEPCRGAILSLSSIAPRIMHPKTIKTNPNSRPKQGQRPHPASPLSPCHLVTLSSSPIPFSHQCLSVTHRWPNSSNVKMGKGFLDGFRYTKGRKLPRLTCDPVKRRTDAAEC